MATSSAHPWTGALLALCIATVSGYARAEPTSPPTIESARPASPSGSAVATPAASAAPVPPAPRSSPHDNTAAFVVAGLAVASAAVGAVLGVVALDDKSDFDKNPTTAKANAGNQDAAYCDATLGAALVLGVTSVFLFLTRDDAAGTVATRSPLVTASPMVSPRSAGVGATLHF